MFEFVKGSVGPIDVLVNNAGIGGSEGALSESSKALELLQRTAAAVL
jgi:NAD(P)-dependent dehydrogenase (short-subunit alcohol dehydrogenase family)